MGDFEIPPLYKHIILVEGWGYDKSDSVVLQEEKERSRIKIQKLSALK